MSNAQTQGAQIDGQWRRSRSIITHSAEQGRYPLEVGTGGVREKCGRLRGLKGSRYQNDGLIQVSGIELLTVVVLRRHIRSDVSVMMAILTLDLKDLHLRMSLFSGKGLAAWCQGHQWPNH